MTIKIREIRPNKCPRCASRKVFAVIYGYPTEKDRQPTTDRKFILDGRGISPGAPIWLCEQCAHMWGSWRIRD